MSNLVVQKNPEDNKWYLVNLDTMAADLVDVDEAALPADMAVAGATERTQMAGHFLYQPESVERTQMAAHFLYQPESAGRSDVSGHFLYKPN